MKLPILIALAVVGTAAAQDIEREARLAAEIVDAILDGEPVQLEADGREFLGIYTESEEDAPHGAVIILHGRGFHPDWDQVVNPLRTALPAHGWHTLSLQMPVLGKDAKYNDYVPILPTAFPRIAAGLSFFETRGIENVVLIAHSCSVHMTMAFIREQGDEKFDAYVGIGMGATDFRQPMKKPFPLESMRVPVLDIYGSDDYPGVGRHAPRRFAAMRAAGNENSRQMEIDGADHFFDGKDEALVEAVAGWLESVQR